MRKLNMWKWKKEKELETELRNYKFEKVESFKYLGTLFSEVKMKKALNESNQRMQPCYSVFFRCKVIMNSTKISKSTEIRIYKTVIRPTIICAAETLCLIAEMKKN